MTGVQTCALPISTIQANRALLDRFLDRVSGRPVILVGNSMGGLISMMEAAARPDSVAGLVLVDPALPRALRTRPDPFVTAAFAAYAVPGIGERLVRRRYRTLGPDGLVRDTLRMCCVDPSLVPQETVDAMIEVARQRMQFAWAQPSYLAAARSLVTFMARRSRVTEIITSIAAPTLLIQGTHDRLVSLASAREAARLRPDWSFEIFDNIGHVPMLEAPERFVETVSAWMDGAGRAAVLAAAADPARG